MKRYNNIYPKIYEIENIKLAHKMARQDKSFYQEVKMVDEDIDKYALQIQEMLINKTYKINSNDYEMFEKNDKGKIRQIFKLDYYPHRIVQWACMLQIQEILLKSFTDDTYSAIPNRGIHLASSRIKTALNEDMGNMQYCLKIDIKKYYPNIDREVLKQLYRKKFKDEDLLRLLDMIIDSLEGEKGIAIGSLISQWMGNFYLSYLDHWVKEELGIKQYYRYMDDCLIFHNSKEELHNIFHKIEKYLTDNLKLRIKENWQIFPTYVRGVDFVGYRHFKNYTLLRKSTSTTFKRKMRHLLKKCQNGEELTYSEWCSINSYKGWIEWCSDSNAKELIAKYINPLLPYCDNYYKKYVVKTKVKINKRDSDMEWVSFHDELLDSN